MPRQTITVYELAPAADELWEMDHDAQSGTLDHAAGAVSFPDVASGAKLRPRITAYYASGKATNIARVFDAFFRPEATTPPAQAAQSRLAARLVTALPGQPGGYRRPDIPGVLLSQFTPGGAYMACLQARDFRAVDLSFATLPPSGETQVDRRCANLFSHEGGELINFSPYLYWDAAAVEATLRYLAEDQPGDFVGLAGSLPLVDGAAATDTYARAIAAIRERNPQAVISLDVGGAPLQACLEGGHATSPDVVSINTDEYAAVEPALWRSFAGVAAVHDKRGCWLLRGEALSREDFDQRPPDVRTVPGVRVVHTICAGDAAHGGLLLGLMLHGMSAEGLREAALLSQACGLTIVEGHDSIRGLTAERVEANLARVRAANG